ncbi:MAG: ribonuclease III [Oscillospiraceae bacterium]|nr:ribonuclease III [Oscillospiraceae bacterium]
MDILTPHQAKQYSPAAMAFLGDAVYSELVRRHLLLDANMPIGKLHKQSVALVRAASQARAYELILPLLGEDEADILRRGRNATHTHNTPKSSDIEEYTRATALEALFGYLKLMGNDGRINDLFNTIWENFTR